MNDRLDQSRENITVAITHQMNCSRCGWKLTERQTAILKMIAESKTLKQIALELKLSVKTIEAHKATIMETLEIHDVAGLTRFAIREGLTRNE